MIKKLSIFLTAILMVASLQAQPAERSGSAMFAPRAGQWQVSMVLGRGLFYPTSIQANLLPSYSPAAMMDGRAAVLDLHLGSLNDNSIANIAGIQAKYFLTNRWEINAMFSMDITSTPHRDYVEGIDLQGNVYGVDGTLLTTDSALGTEFLGDDKNLTGAGGLQYLEGKLTNSYIGTIGSNFYLNNCNGRIFPYVGLMGGFQHSRIQTFLPYTGITVETINPSVPGGQTIADPLELYMASSRAGEAYSIMGAVTAGVEYNFLPGFNVAFEIRPFNYYYGVARLYNNGTEWNGDNHQFKFFAFPQLKLGIRF